MEDCEFIIFHIADLQKEKPKMLEGVRYIDVSGMSFSKIDKIVENLDIDLWMNLNFRSLFELFFQRVSARHGIKHIYLQHGFFSQNTLHFKTNKAQKNVKSTIIRQVNFWKKYMGLLSHSKHICDELKIVIEVYFKGHFNSSPFNHYFIFSEREKTFLSKIYSPADSEITMVGYPIFSDSEEKSRLNIAPIDKKEVLYVHQPFIIDSYTNIGYEEEKEYLLAIEKEILKKFNKFIVLLHPRENLEKYKERFSNTTISIVQSPNNYNCFADKSLILGHYSTALLYALYFNKPTIILKYPGTSNDSVFEDYFPVVNHIQDIYSLDVQVGVNDKNYLLGEVNTYEHIADIIKKIGTKNR